MYKNEFDKLHSNNTQFKAYMFYGQSHYLVEEYALNIAKSFGNDDEIEKIYFDDFDVNYAKDKLLQSSLFSSNNILLIKLEKKLNKKDTMQLVDAANSNPDSMVIFACLGDSDFKTMGGYFTPKSNAVSVRMFTPYTSEAMKLLENKAKEYGIDYDISALNHLYFMHRNDLSLCMNDLKKLSILNESISAKVVEKHCFGIGAVSLEDFLHHLISGASFTKDLYFLLEEGMNEVYLVNQITAFVQQLFMISAYARSIGTPDAKEILGFMPPKAIWEKKNKIGHWY
jgi:DNA polymerase-3 subunit delta